MRDGLDKDAFVAAKRKAYEGRNELRHLVEHVDVDDSKVGTGYAVVRTRVTLGDGSELHNDVSLVRRSSGWAVMGYQLVPTPPQPV
jgi:hypothetical protein